MITGFSILADKLKDTKIQFLIGNKYIYAVLILIAFILFAKLFLVIVKRFISKITAKTKTCIDDKLIAAGRAPVYYLLIIFGIYASMRIMGISEKSETIVSNILFSILILIFAILAIRVFRILIGFWGETWAKNTKMTLDDDILPLLNKIMMAVIIIIALLSVLKVWGVNITGFLAGLGIAGIAIGFAVQDSLKNIFGGVSLMLDRNFKIADRIRLDSGEIGEVKDIGLRSTKILTLTREMLIVPNGMLANSKFENMALPDSRIIVKIKFGVAYGSDVKKVKKTIIEAVKNIGHVLHEPEPNVRFTDMGDSSLNFICFVWVDHYKNANETTSMLNEAVYNALNKAKIGIPFPTRTVYMKK